MANPGNFHTKLVGTTFEGRQEAIARCRNMRVKNIKLTREPFNRWDDNAIAVEATFRNEQGDLETIQLGYIANAESACRSCGKEYQRPPRACQICGGTEFRRVGLATQMAKAMSDGIGYKAQVTQYTGGEAGRSSLGVNIHIERLEVSVPV